MSLNFKAAKERLLKDVPGFCAHYLPGGAIKGDWYLVRVPWRADKTPSLGVSLTTGHFKDFGRPDDCGDIIELLARLKRQSAADVVRDLTGG